MRRAGFWKIHASSRVAVWMKSACAIALKNCSSQPSLWTRWYVPGQAPNFSPSSAYTTSFAPAACRSRSSLIVADTSRNGMR